MVSSKEGQRTLNPQSGGGARPMHPEWVRGLRDQVHTAGAKLFVKQIGSNHALWPNVTGKGEDPAQWPDPSTVRRWVVRRLIAVWCWMGLGARSEHFFRTPTILAWDLGVLYRILPIEARSP